MSEALDSASRKVLINSLSIPPISASGDEFEVFVCLALVGAIRQLADLSTHAESIFEELASESKRVFDRYNDKAVDHQPTNKISNNLICM